MIDYPTVVAISFVSILFGGVVGVLLAHQHAARDLARLRLLVPSPGLLRRAAAFAGGYGVMVRNPANATEMAAQLRTLAARIEAAGVVSVPPAWEQTPTGRE